MVTCGGYILLYTLWPTMRRATFSLTGQDGGFYPADRALASTAGVYRDSILQLNLLNDGTCVILYELHGNMDRAGEVLDNEPTVIKHDLTVGNPGAAYFHFHPNETVRKLLNILQKYPLILKPPVNCLRDGVQSTIISDDATIQQAVEEIPERLTLTLENISDYTHASNQPLEALTRRQREILFTAAEHGYYDIPRRTSHNAVADELGLSESTVTEHLQKVEAKLIRTLIPK